MNTNSLAWLAFKLMGIYTLLLSLSAFAGVPGLLASVPSGSGRGALWLFLLAAVPIGFLVLLSVILLTRTGFLVNLIVEKNDRDNSQPLVRSDLQRLGFSVVAVYLVGDALPRIASFLCMLAAYRTSVWSGYGASASAAWNASWPSLVRDMAESALGCALFFGSKGLSRFWERFQNSRITDERW
jgi:hypothetical protein